MLQSNIHTHTRFSDGANTAEEMVRAALAKGFVSLGFSDHGFAPRDAVAMSPETERAYCAEILRLKQKYAGQIELILGYEHDATHPDADLSPYEVVIESVHFVEAPGEYPSIDHTEAITTAFVNAHFGGDYYALCRAYFERVAATCMSAQGDIIGHIGLVSKFNESGNLFDMSDARYVQPALDALACAVERGKLVEINTGAMARGYRTEPYPGRALLRALNEMGGRIIINSDCHSAATLDFAFDTAAALARSCGFRERYIRMGGAYHAVAL